MLGNFYRRSMDQNKHVNKKQNAASGGGQGKYNFLCPPLEAALSILNLSLFCFLFVCCLLAELLTYFLTPWMESFLRS